MLGLRVVASAENGTSKEFFFSPKILQLIKAEAENEQSEQCFRPVFILHGWFLLKLSARRRTSLCLLLLPGVLFPGSSVEMLTSGLENLRSSARF